jgi:initiation factor 1A
MPNQQGGKQYKKSKHATPEKATLFLPEADQIFGRVIRNLGQRRMLVFSNDNKIRMCHIRGSMRRGSSWITIGDIVLITRRDFEKLPEKAGEYENADIISRYEKDLHSDLKKIQGINPKLFLQIETVDSKLFAEIVSRKIDELKPDDDLGIEFGESSEEDDENDEDVKEDGTEVKRKKGTKGWKAERSQQDRVEVGATTFEREDGEINIDAI